MTSRAEIIQRYQEPNYPAHPAQPTGFGGLAQMGLGGLSMMGLGGLPAQPQQSRGIISGLFENIRQQQALCLAQTQTAIIGEQRDQLAHYIEMAIMVATAADQLADVRDEYRHQGAMRALTERGAEAAILKLLAETEAIKASIYKTPEEIEQDKLNLDLTREKIARRRLKNAAKDIENQLARLEMEIRSRGYQQNFADR